MTLYSATITLFLVMDPLGNIPIFISLLKNMEANKRVKIILRESAIAFFVLTLFLLGGNSILSSLHITQPALGISGGIILFLIALQMIFSSPSETPERYVGEPFIVPLAIPLLAGPSALATVLLFSTQAPDKNLLWFAAIAIASGLSTLLLLFAMKLKKLIGQKALIAFERLMGMLLTTIAVQMFLSGIDAYFFKTLH